MNLNISLYGTLIMLSIGLLFSCAEQKQDNLQVVNEPKVTASAELISLDNATIGPPNVSRMWQFKIQKMAPENKLVKQGEVIIVFDGQQLKNDLIGKESELKAAQKKAESDMLQDQAAEQELMLKLAEAEMEFEKAKRKAEIVDASRSEIERQKQQADYRYQTENLAQAKQKLAHHKKAMLINQQVSQGKIKSLQSRVDSIRQELAKLSVKAPKDGLVMYRENGQGEKVAVGETIWMGRSILQLPSIDKIALKAEFAEPDKAKLVLGQQVKVVFEAYPEMSYLGHIAELGQAFYPKSANNPKVVFDAIIELDEARPQVMRPGMKAKIEVLEV